MITSPKKVSLLFDVCLGYVPMNETVYWLLFVNLHTGICKS